MALRLTLGPYLRSELGADGQIYVFTRSLDAEDPDRPLPPAWKVVCPSKPQVDRSTGKKYRMHVEDDGRLVVTELAPGAGDRRSTRESRVYYGSAPPGVPARRITATRTPPAASPSTALYSS